MMTSITNDIDQRHGDEPAGVQLLRCAQAGDLGAMRAIHNLVAIANWHDPASGDALLHEPAIIKAARGGHAEMVAFLLDHGASPDATFHRKRISALMVAAYNGHAGVVGQLLDRGATLQHASEDRSTALAHGARSLAVTQTLLARGAGALLQDPTLAPPLLLAMNLKVSTNILFEQMDYRQLPERREVVRVLLEAGADPDGVSLWTPGLTPLMGAAYLGCEEIYAMLLRAGANPHARDGKGRGVAEYYADHLQKVRGYAIGEPPPKWRDGLPTPFKH